MLNPTEKEQLNARLRAEPRDGENQLTFFTRVLKEMNFDTRYNVSSGLASFMIRRAKGLQRVPREKKEANDHQVDIVSATDMLLDIRVKAKKGLEEIDFERNRIQERLLVLDDTAAKFKKILG